MSKKNRDYISRRTDKYFLKTRKIIENFGNSTVEYGVFMRRDVIVATKLAVDLIKKYSPSTIVTCHYEDGTVVPPKTKILTIKGPFSELVELETLWLQRLGFTQTCAYNAYRMSLALPNCSFLDMHGRHATGDDMVIAAAYGASIGSRTARLQGAKGFIGTSNDLTAHYFPIKIGLGTIPHAVIGYAGMILMDEWKQNRGNNHISQKFKTPEEYAKNQGTLKSIQMYYEANPNDKNIVSLVDYYGNEITDAINCADWFFNKAKLDTKGYSFGIRLDTNGERFLETLNYEKSVEVICDWIGVHPVDEYAAVRKIIGNDVFDAASDSYIDKVRRILFGKGVSAANIMQMRRKLNEASFNKAKIIASSGFDLFKCQIMGKVNAPIDTVGTGSFLPKTLSETYSTADIIRYNGTISVKVGREWLVD